MYSEKLINDVNVNKRIIFTITSGRSGTGYLAEILSKHQNVTSFHEPEPSFKTVMRAVQNDPEMATLFWLEKKLPAIYKTNKPVYIETSHLFSKGFLDSILNIGIIPDLILLERSSREIAKSLYQLNTIPGKTEKGWIFCLSPSDKNLFLRLPDWEDFNDYQLCFWYTLEILIRQKRYAVLVNNLGGKTVRVSTESLNSFEYVELLVKQLGLNKLNYKAKRSIKELLNKKVNEKRNNKIIFPFDLSQLFRFEREIYERTSFFKYF